MNLFEYLNLIIKKVNDFIDSIDSIDLNHIR